MTVDAGKRGAEGFAAHGLETFTATDGHPFLVLSGERLDLRGDAEHVPLYEPLGTARGRWVRAAELVRAANARSDFNIGFSGYRFNGDIGAYTVRFRHYDPTPGMCRWLERDPAGYQDGPSLYSYLGRNPMAGTDPYGLFYSGSGITVIAPDQIRPPAGASEIVNPPGYGLRPTLLPPDMPGHNEVLAWAEALSAIARSNAERGVDYRRDQSGFSAVGAFEGLADGAILIANSFACGWVPGLNRAAEQVRTANAGSMAYTVADWSASVGTALLPIGGGVKGFNLGMKAASGGAKHRVFYSGFGRDPAAREYLQGWAARRGWVTIDQTLLGRAAGQVAKGWLRNRFGDRSADAVWKGASWLFARYAGKNSSVVLGDWAVDGVWNTVEAVVLKRNGIDFNVFRYRPNSPLPAGWSPRRRRRPFRGLPRRSGRSDDRRRGMA